MPKSAFAPLLVLCLVPAPASTAEAGADADLKRAGALFTLAFEGRCAEDAFSAETLAGAEGVTYTYRNTTDKNEAAPNHATLYTFFCDRFHNSGSAAFILKDNEGHFQVVTFATPISVFRSEAGGEGNLVPAGLAGISTTDTLLNGEFDPETLTISAGTYELGREYFASYAFRDGAFVFADDQSYRIKDGALVLDPRETDEDP